MNSVREESSTILGVSIPKDGWEKVVAELEVLGRFDEAKVHKMIIMLAKKIEEYENVKQPKSK